MMGLHRLPIRTRLTVAFAATMAVLFTLIALSLYVREATVLLDEIDSGLRFRAEALEADAPHAPSLAEPAPGLIVSNEAFAQLANADGTVLRSSPGLTTPLLRVDELATVRGPMFFERRVPGVEAEARLLAVPLDDPLAHVVIIVGTSMSDRIDALHQFKVFLGIFGPLAIGLASLAGWGIAALALRPVERMRQQASAITASGTDRHLALPAANDEIRRLGETLNDMLTRLDEAMQGQRRLLDRASHELRTPLTALKAELDIALSQPRTATELLAALTSASEEADRMARLADDLLVLARINNGRLPVHRQTTSLRELSCKPEGRTEA